MSVHQASRTRILAAFAIVMAAGALWPAVGLTRGQAQAAPVGQEIPGPPIPPPVGPRTIQVVGDGEARAEPDIATVSVGVLQTGSTAQGAMGELSRRSSAVVAAVKGLGLQDRDIQTTNVSLQPVFSRRPSNGAPEIEGYWATINFSLRVRDLGGAAAVLDAATSAGANTVSGVRFGSSRTADLRAEAAAEAIGDARQKAEQMAAAAGARLGEVLSIQEDGVALPRPLAAAAGVAREAAAVPIEPGEITFRARVHVTFALVAPA